MKVLYWDCGMGAAGDMLTASLLELMESKEQFIERLNEIGIPTVKVVMESSTKCGIAGTKVRVMIEGEEEHVEDVHHHEHHHADGHAHHHSHHHTSMEDVEQIIRNLKVSEKVQKDAIAVYKLIAEAESKAHNAPVSEVHFHEVGMMDAIADVVAVCMLLDEIRPDKIVASPIHVGSGKVKCAHGIMPVPAPATANILSGVPIYGGAIAGELCTPTGAALLKYFVNEFGNMPMMCVEHTGYGMGTKDFEAANCVRAILGTVNHADATEVVGLSCNIDDMTGEEIGFAIEQLLALGAREAYAVPVVMKKSRPGHKLEVLCDRQDVEKMVELIFKHTSTIGIRQTQYNRYVLERESMCIETPYGTVRKKMSSGYGVEKNKYEYDDLSKIAREQNVSLREAIRMIDCIQ